MRGNSGSDLWQFTVGPVAHSEISPLGDYLQNKGYHSIANYTHSQNLERDNALKFSGFIHGGVNDVLTVPQTKIQKTLDLAAIGNEGLVANMKHQYRIRCDTWMAIPLYLILVHILIIEKLARCARSQSVVLARMM